MNNNFHLDRQYIQEPLEYEDIFLLQIGRLYCKSTTVIDPHIHTDLFELTIVTDGEGVVTTNGISTAVKKGDIYLSMPCDVHEIKTDSKNLLRYDFFAFSVKEGGFKQELERIAQNFHSGHNRVFQDEHIEPLISNAVAELNTENIYSNEILASIFRQILIYIIRDFEEITPKPHSNKVTQSEVLCYKLMNYIDTHIYSMKNLQELSAVTDYSYGYLSALFKKTTSDTLSNYYHKKKLEAARLLVLENKLTVTEIAEMLNYASGFALSKAFSKEFGMSPVIYRKSTISPVDTP